MDHVFNDAPFHVSRASKFREVTRSGSRQRSSLHRLALVSLLNLSWSWKMSTVSYHHARVKVRSERHYVPFELDADLKPSTHMP